MRNLIIFGLLILAVGIGFAGLYMFNKKVPDLEGVPADFKVSADELFDAFERNETEALANYENKVLAVTGKVISIKHGEVSSNIILHAKNAMAGGINCSFSVPQRHIEVNDLLTIKGRCQGFLMDVVLNNCMIDEKN